MSGNLELEFFLSLVAVAGASLFALSFALLKRKHLIQNLPSSPIRSMAMGLAEVAGRAVSFEPLTAPISGTSCVHYTLDIVRNPGAKQAHTEQHRAQSQPFGLDDGTGLVLVDPKGADFVGLMSTVHYIGSASDMPDACHAYFQTAGIREKYFGLFSERFSIQEKVCPVGQPLFVLGNASPPPEDSGNEYRAAFARDPAAPCYLISGESQKQYLSDLNEWVWLGLVGGPLVAIGSLAGLLLMNRGPAGLP